MVIIRAEQMKAFDQAAWRRFEQEMVEHSREFSPRLCEVIGDEQLRAALRSAMDRAEGYGFTCRGPIRLFIELMFLCGSAFDTDPQYEAIVEALRGSGDQMQRAQQIHERHNEYLDKVSGSGAANVRRALKDLLILAQMPVAFSPDDLVAGLLRETSRIFPQKVAYVGEERLTTLIHEGIAEARRYGFSTVRQNTLIVVLMFAFGHGCTNDPLYPWIARTLRDDRIVDPAARAERLEKKAVTWLKHVLARPQEGSQT
jgi:hypothetical protein